MVVAEGLAGDPLQGVDGDQSLRRIIALESLDERENGVLILLHRSLMHRSHPRCRIVLLEADGIARARASGEDGWDEDDCRGGTHGGMIPPIGCRAGA